MVLGADPIILDRRNFWLNYAWPNNFGRSQWGGSSRTWNLVYVIWRWILFLYWLSWLIADGVVSHQGGKFFIYMTHWGAIFEAIYFGSAATIATVYHIWQPFGQNGGIMPRNQWENRSNWVLKIFWVLSTMVYVYALVITLTYWIALHKSSQGFGSAENFDVHGMNSILLFVDMLIIATPWRFFHFWVPIPAGLLYMLFSIIYYATGGTDTAHHKYIYPIIDYGDHPGVAVGVILCLAFVAIPIVHIIFCLLYLLRRFIYQKCIIERRHPDGRITVRTTRPEPLGVETIQQRADPDGMEMTPQPVTLTEPPKV